MRSETDRTEVSYIILERIAGIRIPKEFIIWLSFEMFSKGSQMMD